ncbi:MAG: NUDIX domain-containing protein [Cruoricaptor ignavus]|nr:NUDIX domain-containing protein [Cruoricaptor ignavus]
MYKVFVNEKKLMLSKSPEPVEKNLNYENISTLEMALDYLENTSCTEVNVYGESLDDIWGNFVKLFKPINAAGGIVKNKEGKILFIYRLEKWDLPKGKIEKNESLEDAAIREVQEETALQELVLGKFINNTFHIYTERNGKKVLKTTHWFAMDYVGNEMPVPQTEEGITEVTWKDEQEISRDVLPNTFQNIKLILEEATI